MKSFSFLALVLVLGLFAGCSPKANTPSAPMTSDVKPDPNDPGEIFLAANAKKDGVTTTASGLQYKVIKSGTGASPKATDQVKVHYTGTTIDGHVFDSSVQRGQPAVFPVNAVIPGWVEALQLMKVGDKWQLFIPARLAYGARSPSPAIPPNSVLIFEVELIDIE
jgi:FKBP-type peptidyl-prolyl cis-trans isomerase FklB